MEKSNINVGIFMDREEKTMEEKTKNRGDGSVDVIRIEHLTQIFNEGTPNEYRLFEDFNLTIPDFVGKGQKSMRRRCARAFTLSAPAQWLPASS